MSSTRIRRLVIDYLDRLREFNDAFHSVDSGILTIEQRAELHHNPSSILDVENEFINQMISVFHEFSRFVSLGEKRYSHLSGLATHLGLSDEEGSKILMDEQQILQFLRLHQRGNQGGRITDSSYFRWVIVDTSEELDRLIVEMQNLHDLTDAAPIRLKRFQSAFFQSFHAALSQWKAINLDEFVGTLQEHLDAAVVPSLEDVVSALTQYLDIGVKMLRIFALLEGGSNIRTPKVMKRQRAFISAD